MNILKMKISNVRKFLNYLHYFMRKKIKKSLEQNRPPKRLGLKSLNVIDGAVYKILQKCKQKSAELLYDCM